jgi:hypothetical protein
MPHATVTAGLPIERPGAEQYSSDGYHLTVEMEAEIENAGHFRAVARALFAEVKAALEAKVGATTVEKHAERRTPKVCEISVLPA